MGAAHTACTSLKMYGKNYVGMTATLSRQPLKAMPSKRGCDTVAPAFPFIARPIYASMAA